MKDLEITIVQHMLKILSNENMKSEEYSKNIQ